MKDFNQIKIKLLRVVFPQIGLGLRRYNNQCYIHDMGANRFLKLGGGLKKIKCSNVAQRM